MTDSTRPEYSFNGLPELDSIEYSFIGMSAFSGFRRIKVYRSSIWLGYHWGKCFFQQRNHTKWAAKQAGLKHYNYFADVLELLETIGGKYEHPTLYLPSQHAIKAIVQDFPAYKKTTKWFPQLRYMVKTFQPEFKYYFPLSPPFSLLRELCYEFNKNILKKVDNQEYYDYTGWNEI